MINHQFLEAYQAPPGAWGLALSTVRAMARVNPEYEYTVSAVAEQLYPTGSAAHDRATRSIRRLLEGFSPIRPHSGNQGAVYSGNQILEALDQDLSKQEIQRGVIGLNRARGWMAEEIVALVGTLPDGDAEVDLRQLFDDLRVARYAKINEVRIALRTGAAHPLADQIREASKESRDKAITETWGSPATELFAADLLPLNNVQTVDPVLLKPLEKRANGVFGRLRKTKLFRRLALASLALTALGSAGALATRPHLFQIMTDAGPRAAIEYVVKIEDGLGAYFESAWVHYRNGDFDVAREMAQTILNAQPPVHLEGNCLLLLGRINVEAGQRHVARTYFQSALEIYPGDRGQYAELEIARLDFHEGNVASAREILTRIELPPGYEEGLLYLVELFGEPAQAVELARKMYNSASNTEEKANWASNLGCALIVTGQYENGHSYTLEADRYWVEMGYERGYYFTQINHLLHDKGKGLSYQDYQKGIERWAENREDTELKHLLQWSLDLELPPSGTPVASAAGR